MIKDFTPTEEEGKMLHKMMSDFARLDNLIVYLKSTLGKGLGFLKADKRWQIAFEWYNLKNRAPLLMGCRPCYHKVLFFLIQVNK